MLASTVKFSKHNRHPPPPHSPLKERDKREDRAGPHPEKTAHPNTHPFRAAAGA